tara:strand:+ start:747 stop:2510 length:1764 start_codon:yes stop_codon:yes gene_type:complete
MGGRLDMAQERKVDIITLGLINNFLYSLVDEMTMAAVRTSFSPLTRDAFDFQCGFCHADGEMLLEGEGTLIHSLIYPGIIKNWLKTNRDSTYPGDVIATNDPFSGAAHLPDIYLMKPIFVEDELVAWSVAGGHLRDVGGSTPGSCDCESTEIYQEGLRYPPMKLYDRGVPNETLLDIIKANSRVPEIITGDIEAFRSACHAGESRFLELVKDYGWETIDLYFGELLDYAERLTRAEIKAMPDGEYDFIDYIDDDGVDPGAVKLQLKITVANDTITYDFTGTSPQRKGAINNPYASSTACIISALRFMISHDIPKNSGTWRPVKAIIPEGSVLNPKLPAAVAARGVTIGRLVDVMLGAENKIAPDKMMGCPTGVDTLLNVGGQDKTGKLFIFSETIWGGWGGRSTADGVDYNTPPYLNGGNQPVESNEELYPIIYRQHGYAEDTEGAGKYRGSLGLVREIEFVGDEPAAMQLRVDRRQFPPFGIHGGQSGTPTRATINPDTENRDVGKSTITLNKGDVFRVVVAGAGGYGNPFERSVDMVLDDVLKEKISTRRAREAYGVAIDENSMKVDEGETQRLRETLANDRNKS